MSLYAFECWNGWQKTKQQHIVVKDYATQIKLLIVILSPKIIRSEFKVDIFITCLPNWRILPI